MQRPLILDSDIVERSHVLTRRKILKDLSIVTVVTGKDIESKLQQINTKKKRFFNMILAFRSSLDLIVSAETNTKLLSAH